MYEQQPPGRSKKWLLLLPLLLAALISPVIFESATAQNSSVIIWVSDKGVRDSQFGYFDGTTSHPLGPSYAGRDIEGLSCLNNVVYASSGRDGLGPSSLYTVAIDIAGNNATLTQIADIQTAAQEAFYEVVGLTSKADGTLWGYADKAPLRGIIRIDPATAVAELVAPSTIKIEGIAWIGDTLWLAGDNQLYRWTIGGAITLAFSVNGIGEIEGLEAIDGLLYAGIDAGRRVIVIDPNSGAIVPKKGFTAAQDVESLASCGVTAPPPPVATAPPKAIYLSSSDNESVQGLVYRDEDIVLYDPVLDTWSMFFDGSDVGLAKADLEDFEILDNGDIIFTLNKPFKIPNPAPCGPSPLEVDDSDIVRFTPSLTGDTTDGCFAIFLKGADIGLTKGEEDIDALGFAPDGRLLISTIGNAKVPGPGGEIEAKDEDLLAYNLTTQTWSFYFDGSDVKLTRGGEDVASIWVDPQGDLNHYMSTKEDFDAAGATNLSGENDDAFGCTPFALDDTGPETKCYFFEFFKEMGADDETFDDIDGLYVVFNTTAWVGAAQANPGGTQGQVAAVDPDDEIDAADFAEAVSEGSTEIDEYDFIDDVQHLYLPQMFR